jgi:hypothetical protein
MRHRAWLATVVGLCISCGPSRVVETALYGDLAALKAEISRAQRAGELDSAEVADLADAVARREIRSSSGRGAADRVHQAQGCAGAVRAELEERSHKADDPGAAAALVLLEAGLVDGRAYFRRYANAASAPWRAVGARASTRRSDGDVRRRLFADPDERVRRAALRAALSLRDPNDLEALLEAARLDPDANCRSLASRAAGAIGGERAVLALRDRWARIDETERLTVIEAWALPASYATGGKAQLVRVAEKETGLLAIASANALIAAESDASGTALRVLVRAVGQGTTEERRLAIALVPLFDPGEGGRSLPAVVEALVAAAEHDDLAVRVSALARLGERPERRSQALAKLRAMAAGQSARRAETANEAGKEESARRARLALADASDRSVEAALRVDLGSSLVPHRREAALGLIRLGRLPSAATVLGDDDPSLRMEVACAILAADR